MARKPQRTSRRRRPDPQQREDLAQLFRHDPDRRVKLAYRRDLKHRIAREQRALETGVEGEF